eukprot:Hpha_TRINITY_DN20298_c0_g1::TRINITY_DN20298_c0_g1_i1::g.168245::m.168245/K08770/UBC; ubiquitin C
MAGILLYVRVDAGLASPDLAGGLAVVEVPPDAAVSDVKAQLVTSGAVLDDVDMEWQGKRLNPTDLLAEVGLCNQATLAACHMPTIVHYRDREYKIEISSTHRVDEVLTKIRDAIRAAHHVYDGKATAYRVAGGQTISLSDKKGMTLRELGVAGVRSGDSIKVVDECWQVFIKTLTGAIITVDFGPETTVADLKHSISVSTLGFPVESQRLIFNARCLEDDHQTLHGIKHLVHESTLHLVLRRRRESDG